MTAWIIGTYFVGFGICFLFLFIAASIADSVSLGAISPDIVTFVLLGSFLWPVLLVISIVAGVWMGIKRLVRKETNGLQNTT